MNIDNKLNKVSMFLDGELSNTEMNKAEKIIDSDDDVKDFIISSAKATAYSKSFFRNEIYENENKMPENKTTNSFRFMLKAASILLLVGIGILAGGIFRDRPGSNLAFKGNIINPAYQNILNIALENYQSGKPFKSNLSEPGEQITIIPVKTYKYNDKYYLRKFKIICNLSGKTININGFAERKSKESWEIKTLSL